LLKRGDINPANFLSTSKEVGANLAKEQVR